jgi:hypothetical protein
MKHHNLETKKFEVFSKKIYYAKMIMDKIIMIIVLLLIIYYNNNPIPFRTEMLRKINIRS